MKAYIQDKGTLVVGITEFAPMDYKDENGEWIGFDADMARKVAEALGVDVEFSVIEWGNKLFELDGKTVSAMAYVMQPGFEAAAQDAGLTYVSVSDQATALMEVNSGTSDACIVDLLMAGAMIGEGTSYPDLTYTVRLAEEQYGVGCRKGSDLTDFINEQFKILYEDGTITELAEQYGISDNIVPQE